MSPPDLLDRYRAMVRIRRFEERCAELYSSERIRGFVHLSVGEEAVAVGVLDRLDADDAVVSTYREHGHALARGIPMGALMAEMLGRVDGASRGRGGSMHIFDATTRFYGGHAIVGAGLPVAVGLALADRLRGMDRVTVCFFGDGAMAEGVFHESANLAALWRLPVLFVCENNRYAMGTALARHQAETDLALRAASYRMASWAVDGMDVEAVGESTDRAVDRIRAGGGPVFVEALTYRFRAHSMYDADRYRDPAEIQQWRERDPLTIAAARLAESGRAAEPALTAVDREVIAEVDAAVAFAEASGLEEIDDLARHAVSDGAPA